MSAFARTFSDLKKSEFYKEPEINVAEDQNKRHPSTSAASENKGHLSSVNNVLVNPRQRGNPLLKSIRNVPWEFEESLVPDYVMGQTSCALFLSLRYHILNPDYIHERLKTLGKLYELRVLLVQVDAQDPHHALKYLTRVCLLANLTLMLAWSAEEAGRIIETYKIFENKPPDLIMEKKEDDPFQKLISALTSVRSINKTDANTLLSTMGSMERILKATKDELALCPGLGPQKAVRLHKVLHMPFICGVSPKTKLAPVRQVSKTTEEENTKDG
ncbi:DNA excision repair protein ERCC-1 isoform X1 [Hetaerina americana]|uniref:DNA excision repair protein ERCC-1 isoform X1 n=1 Tax=Hetaerina americana TaxID=62018 RepID=UPI003A7F148E